MRKKRENKRKREKRSYQRERRNEGITLIALVITIIVLLILAGVTIATLTGENGILTKAEDAKEETKKSQTEERIKLCVTAALTDGKGVVRYDNLVSELDTEFGENGYSINPESENANEWLIVVDNVKKMVKNNGDIEDINDESAKYFTYTYNEDGTASITGVNETYAIYDYYRNKENVSFFAALNDPSKGGIITNIVLPSEVEYNGKLYTVTSIEEHAFSDMSGNRNSYDWVSSYVEQYDTSIKTTIVIPDTVTEIGDGAFSTCITLYEIKFGKNVEKIGDYAFSECENLSSITLHNKVSKIGECAFWLCNNLDEVYIDTTILNSVGNYAFETKSSGQMFVRNDNMKTLLQNSTILGTNRPLSISNDYSWQLSE